MKKVIFCLLLTAIKAPYSKAQTQQENISFTQAEFKAGYGINIFGAGLKEAYEAGNFSSSGGGVAILAAYHKFKRLNYVSLGLKFKALGGSPSKGDNDREMFFNYWGSAVGAKFFPFDRDAKKGLYLQADFYFVTQFTQKYRNTKTLDFDHQFAIGNGLAFGLGYDFNLFKNKTPFTCGVEYEMDSRTGEVSGIGQKNFKSSNVAVMLGFKF